MNGLVLFFMVGCVVPELSLLGSTLNRAKNGWTIYKKNFFFRI